MTYTYSAKGVCPTKIQFDIDGDKITNIKFDRGCPGNLKAITKLVDGWTVDQIEKQFKGNTCAFRKTSCVDQLAIAVREAYEKQKTSK